MIDYYKVTNRTGKSITITDKMNSKEVEIKVNPHCVEEFHRDTEFPEVEGLEIEEIEKEVEEEPYEDMDEYYCDKCDRYHKNGSKIFDKHYPE